MFQGAHPLEVMFRTLLTSIGGFLLAFALWIAANNVNVIRTCDPARAEVIKCERKGSAASKGLTRYFVQVKFPAPSGRDRIAEIENVTTSYETGEVADVYFKPETPYKVIGGNFMQMWFHTGWLWR